MSTTDVADPASVVAEMTPMIRSECEPIDSTRAIPTRVVDALREAGVFRLLAPTEIGGTEVAPAVFFDLVEAASYADGSVGWCLMIGGCYATFGGLLPAEGAAEIFGDASTIAAGAGS